MLDNENIKELLYKSGWSEHRKVDKMRLEELIKSSGYEILPAVLDFLVSFDGIVIKFTNLRNGLLDDITFGFELADELEPIDRVSEDYEIRVKQKLCVIGTVYRRYMVLLMGQDGKVYAGYDNILMKMGDSGFEAIKNIINDGEVIEIDELPEK